MAAMTRRTCTAETSISQVLAAPVLTGERAGGMRQAPRVLQVLRAHGAMRPALTPTGCRITETALPSLSAPTAYTSSVLPMRVSVAVSIAGRKPWIVMPGQCAPHFTRNWTRCDWDSRATSLSWWARASSWQVVSFKLMRADVSRRANHCEESEESTSRRLDKDDA